MTDLDAFLERIGSGVLDRPDWQSEGACRGIGAEVTFVAVEREGPQAENMAAVAAAKAICESCPVKAPCLQFALDGYEDGIWEGRPSGSVRRLDESAAPCGSRPILDPSGGRTRPTAESADGGHTTTAISDSSPRRRSDRRSDRR